MPEKVMFTLFKTKHSTEIYHVGTNILIFAFLCRTLDVQPNRVTVGGIRSLEPILQRRGHVESHDFVGCIMEFAVNGRPLEPSQALAAQGILDQYGNFTSYYFKEKMHKIYIIEHPKTELLCLKP